MPTFIQEDKIYFDKRNRFAEQYSNIDLWSVADNWPLFSGIVNIARSLSIYELVKKVIDLPGHFCELGCWNGGNLVFLAKLISIYKARNNTEVYGFDSFEGLKTYSKEQDADYKLNEGKYKGDFERLIDVLQLYDLNEFVHLIKGDIMETLPVFLEERKDIRFSFIYIDVDLYPPTKTALELLYPKLLKGGIIVFDEYNTHEWPGETSAVHEVLGNDVKIHSVPYTRQPTAYIMK